MDNKLAQVAGALRDPEYWSGVKNQLGKLAFMPQATPFGTGQVPSEETLAGMPWIDLMALRKKLKSTEDQNAVAPFEHRAYARENTGNPYEAAQMGLLSLGYTPYKTVFGTSRSDPSLREIGQGLVGTWEGLTKAYRK